MRGGRKLITNSVNTLSKIIIPQENVLQTIAFDCCKKKKKQYVRMYVCTYIHLYVRMYVRMYVIRTHVRRVAFIPAVPQY